jgi:hypothetical protein
MEEKKDVIRQSLQARVLSTTARYLRVRAAADGCTIGQAIDAVVRTVASRSSMPPWDADAVDGGGETQP